MFLHFLSMRHTQTSEAKATEGSSPCPDTNEWNCLCKPFSVYKALKGHCDTFEIPRVIKIQLSTDPIRVHDVSFAFLLPFSRWTLLQNGLMCNLILWIFQRGIVVDGNGDEGVIFQLALWKWAISNSFRFIYEAISESVFITEDGLKMVLLNMTRKWAF